MLEPYLPDFQTFDQYFDSLDSEGLAKEFGYPSAEELRGDSLLFWNCSRLALYGFADFQHWYARTHNLKCTQRAYNTASGFNVRKYRFFEQVWVDSRRANPERYSFDCLDYLTKRRIKQDAKYRWLLWFERKSKTAYDRWIAENFPNSCTPGT